MKIQLKKKDVLFPVPAALIVSGLNGNYNIIAVSWIGMVSSTPPAIGISIQKSRFSFDLIKKAKEFTVNIPSSKYYVETDYCGIVSGRDRNKLADTKFTFIDSRKIKTPIIDECPLNLECKVFKEVEIGEHTMFIGEILEAHIDADKTNDTNRINVDISKVDPLIYCASVREYWTIGKKLGDSFKCGTELKK